MPDPDTNTTAVAAPDDVQRERDAAAAARIGLPHYSPEELEAKNAELRVAGPSLASTPAVSAPGAAPAPVARSTAAAPGPSAAPAVAAPNNAAPRAVSGPSVAASGPEEAPATVGGKLQAPPGPAVLAGGGNATLTPAVAPTALHPARSAIAGLWTKASNISNPFLRVLAKVGTGVLGGGEAIGETLVPGTAAMIPGSYLNTAVRNREAQKQGNVEAQRSIEQENADTARMAATDKANPPAKPFTLSEAQGQAYRDLLGKVNPATGKNYTDQEALQEVQKQPAPAKETPHFTTDPNTGNVMAVTPDGKGGYATSVVYKGTPKVATDVIQRTEKDGTVHNVLVNKDTGADIKDLGQGAKTGPAGALLGDATKTGADYLASLPQAERSLVQEIGTGKMVPSRMDYLASKNPQLLAEVAQAYPEFDLSKAQSYGGTYKDFTSGKTSVALNSGATALKHLSELKKLNTDTSRVPGTKDYNAYNNKLNTVVGELVKFYGMPDTNESISALKAGLGATFNREAAITEQAKSMADKFASYQQTWQNAAPSAAYEAPMPGIDETAKKALEGLYPDFTKDYPQFAPKAQGSAANPTPSGAGGKTPAQLQKDGWNWKNGSKGWGWYK